MPGHAERAVNCWEVERRSCGQVLKPYYVVMLRNKKVGKSVIKATSSDGQSMTEYADQLRKDLYDLTDYEFVSKYQLGSTA
ncbi:MAG TPA: hypothetical protein VFI02_05110 [Armatimonadota bacterium]|nr:hypothetical protein [Armatimonadota bacterium]